MDTIESRIDRENRTLTFITYFEAPPERVWQVWEDPRQLERWWGPPTYPATFTRHEATAGGQSRYYMTSPDGDRSGGWWATTLVDPPNRYEFDDGFAGPDGEPDGSGAAHAVVTLEASRTGTRMAIVTRFASDEQLEQLIAMGMQEGMGLALAQIDAVLAA